MTIVTYISAMQINIQNDRGLWWTVRLRIMKKHLHFVLFSKERSGLRNGSRIFIRQGRNNYLLHFQG